MDTTLSTSTTSPSISSLDAWYLWATIEKGLLPSTVDKYRADLNRLESFAGALPSLSTEEIRSWLHAQGGSASTVANRLAAARSYYRWLVRTSQRDDNPTEKLDRPKVRRGLPKPVSDLTRVVKTLSPEYQAAVTFLAETGLRISEAWAVDIELPVPDALEVTGKGQKERWIPLSAAARRALTRLGGRMPGAKRTFQKYMTRAGITAHRLRHTFACDLVEAGADLIDVQELLGHSSPATTRVYTKVSKRRLRAALDLRSGRPSSS